MFWFTVSIKDDERGFLTRNGKLDRLLAPGRFTAFDPQRRLACEVVKVARAEIALERAMIVSRTHPAIAEENFEIVRTGPTQVGLVALDGQLMHLMPPNTTRAFWTSVTEVTVDLVDTARELRMSRAHQDRLAGWKTQMISEAIVDPNERGLLIVDGEMKEQLAPGRHTFWQVGRTIRIAKFDMRPQALEVTAQEILTKDRIGIRVTLTAFYKVVDIDKALMGAGDVSQTIYKHVQFAIREAVAARTLDEILAARDTLDREVRTFVVPRVADVGVEMGEIGVKDVILPGDIRELLNKVVEAERTAKANLIRRQEETAATRSLLNTARLMDDNPLLLRLKELEALERLVEKVGRIDLHAGGSGGGLEALLSNLYRLSRPTDDGVPGRPAPGAPSPGKT
jgi:regulator of protease activity HflC (stomatin/prohibitin superfamily)